MNIASFMRITATLPLLRTNEASSVLSRGVMDCALAWRSTTTNLSKSFGVVAPRIKVNCKNSVLIQRNAPHKRIQFSLIVTQGRVQSRELTTIRIPVQIVSGLSRRRNIIASATAAAKVEDSVIRREEVVREDDPANNVTDSIFSKIGLQLHRRDDHPLGIIKNEIYSYFEKVQPGVFETFDNLHPVVSTTANFDDVLVPADHVSRSYNDTYYVDKNTVLRCHTSAHQAEMLRKGHTHFLITGDVYRRDSIDATHYPVFHQMEAFRVFSPQELEAAGMDGTVLAAQELKATLEGLTKHLFGNVETRWVDSYFPFTEPSYELEIFFNGEWLEVLGCGVTHKQIMTNCGVGDRVAWAFGLGLERLAMILFDIPDIRLFWSSDKRFTSQFKGGKMGTKFKTFSKYPPCFKDMSFWVNEDFTENNLCEVVRDLAGDLAEEVKLIDNFTNKKGMTSHCYRIAYRSMERSLTDEEINDIQTKVREQVESKLKVTLR